MKLMISVPIFNRKKYLEITAKSLYECLNIDKTSIKVFDDQSTEFDINYLKTLFNKKNTEVIERDNKHEHADAHQYHIIQDFLATDNDVLLFCDSDLLLRPDAIDYIFKTFDRTDGMLGLYNSELHRDIYFDGEFVYKEDVGFAGICVSRKLLEKFISVQKKGRSMDFKLSKFLISQGVRLLVPKSCYVQHIGFDGQNCGSFSVEFTQNFMPLSEFNKEIIHKMIPIAIKMQSDMIKYLLFSDKYRRHGFMLHQPHKYLTKNRKIKKLKAYYAENYPVKRNSDEEQDAKA
ncbi:MAG: glycosyltransferase family 2 protein [Endomicrobium sp.]|jgi:hypothetical protein|nr:glycosyltransferase family 2 protein [Endomicrobium sp.]